MVYKGKSHLEMDDEQGYLCFRKPPQNTRMLKSRIKSQSSGKLQHLSFLKPFGSFWTLQRWISAVSLKGPGERPKSDMI